jgi:hypothetical protein
MHGSSTRVLSALAFAETGDIGAVALNDVAEFPEEIAALDPVAATATPPCTRLGAGALVAASNGCAQVEEFCTAGHFIA